MSLLEINSVEYKYPQSSKKALDNVSLCVERGEYIAVLGSNGSGKSTMARLMAGFFKPDSGTVSLQKDVLPGIVFQQPKEQIVAGIVERDTAFGPQNLSMTKGEIELRTIECLSVVGLADRASSRTFELSLGQTQRLAFSGILALFPDLLILDEVTAMLDPASRNELVEFIDRWNKKGHTVIHVTHDEDEALHAKRIIVMESGRIVFDGLREEFMASPKTIERVFGKDEVPSAKKLPSSDAQYSLCVKDLSFGYPERKIFSGLNLCLKKGTLTALTGPSGCGKSTLFECLAGLKTPQSGTVSAVSRPVLALQESEAALFEPCAADDVAFGPLNDGLSGKELLERVKESMQLAGIPYEDFGDRATFSLSGGEKRKLSLAGIIALDRDILIFDEPTAALDPLSRKNVLRTMKELASRGKTVLFSTHRFEEALYADESIAWQDLLGGTAASEGREPFGTKHQDSPESAGVNETAPEQKKLSVQMPLTNSKMIESIGKTAAAFMAPAKIPHSAVSVLPAALKFILFAAILCVSVLVYSPAAGICMLGVNILYAVLAKYPLKKAAGAFVKLFPWLLLFIVFGRFFYPTLPDDKVIFSCGIFTLSTGRLAMTGRTFLRAACALISAGTFLFTTSEREIMDGLTVLLKPLSVVKIPVRYFVLVTGIIFRFVPMLLDEFCGIIKTQLVRGAFGEAKGLSKLKILVPLFVPLILQTFRKAHYLADALTARYFS